MISPRDHEQLFCLGPAFSLKFHRFIKRDKLVFGAVQNQSGDFNFLDFAKVVETIFFAQI